MFRDTIREVVDGVDGAQAGILMDFEGITVDSYAKAGSAFDVAVIGAELSVILKSIKRAAESLEAGGAREIAFTADKVTTLVRLVNDEYFVALALDPGGNVGKGRYLLRLAAPKLLEELA